VLLHKHTPPRLGTFLRFFAREHYLLELRSQSNFITVTLARSITTLAVILHYLLL
jgi:hypothetical protein